MSQTVRLLTEEEFLSARSDWNRAAADGRWISPMLSWEWLNSWWHVYGAPDTDRELYIPVVLEDDTILGALPFVRHTVGPGKIRRLEFIGTGEDEYDETCSEYLDVIARGNHEKAIVSAIRNTLML